MRFQSGSVYLAGLALLLGGQALAGGGATVETIDAEVPVTKLKGVKVKIQLDEQTRFKRGFEGNLDRTLTVVTPASIKVPEGSDKVYIQHQFAFLGGGTSEYARFKHDPGSDHCKIELKKGTESLSNTQEIEITGVSSGQSDLNPKQQTTYFKVNDPVIKAIFCHRFGSPEEMAKTPAIGEIAKIFPKFEALNFHYWHEYSTESGSLERTSPAVAADAVVVKDADAVIRALMQTSGEDRGRPRSAGRTPI